MTDDQHHQIEDILRDRANEVASYKEAHRDVPDCVHVALSREIVRLRDLARAVAIPRTEVLDDSNPFYQRPTP